MREDIGYYEMRVAVARLDLKNKEAQLAAAKKEARESRSLLWRDAMGNETPIKHLTDFHLVNIARMLNDWIGDHESRAAIMNEVSLRYLDSQVSNRRCGCCSKRY